MLGQAALVAFDVADQEDCNRSLRLSPRLCEGCVYDRVEDKP